MTRTHLVTFATVALLSGGSVSAAPTFPLEAYSSECYPMGPYSGVCTPDTRFLLKANGTVTSGFGDGIWAFFSNTFTMTLMTDTNGDGRIDGRKDYIGTKSGPCIAGDVRDSVYPNVGQFTLCPVR